MAAREEQSASFYYFDDMVVDRENFRVLKAGALRPLEPRVFDLLIFLIENRGRVLEKQELFEQVWKQAFVTDNALTRAVKEIRRALGDDASAPRYVETIPKRGYRFIAEVKTAEESAAAPPSEARRAEDIVTALNYKILKKLGRGGGGVVFLAEDTRLRRPVVLKFLAEELTANELARRRFLREARLASALDHPNICTIYEVNEVTGLDFIVMQYADGQTLKQVIAGKPLELELTLAIALQIAEALRAAHEQSVIHRDLKPDNIIITKKGQVKILDFGLAKSLAFAEGDGAEDATEITRPGAQLGTPAYMSPEQAQGERADHRSDIFSFGVLLYEMATGRTPFKGKSQVETMNAVINTPHTPIAEINEEMPADLAALIDRALAKDPAARYQSIEQMLADLRHVALHFDSLRPALDVPDRVVTSYVSPPRPSLRAMIKSALFGGSLKRRIAFVLIGAAIITAAVWVFWRSANLRWARAQLPRIEELAQARKYFEAFDLAVRAERYLPSDPALEKLMPMVADPLSVTTEPPGARIYLRRFMPDAAGASPRRELVGTSPINNLRIARGDYIITIEKDGYAPFERTLSGGLARVGTALMPPSYALSRIPDIPIDEPFNLALKLIEADKIPDRMVFVPGGQYRLVSWGKPTKAAAPLDDFLIDKFEVTNREYKEFINAGGYLKKSYWQQPFIKDGKPISWEEALQQFRDRTGLAGPRSWAGQDFPAGKSDHPVTDITWYEAAAYATFRGKQLPSIYQWEKAARDGVFTHYSATIMPWGPVEPGGTVEFRANFKSGGTAPVGSFEFGLSPYGCYHMAGNVAEWCRNEVTGGFATAGGSWEDLSYLFNSIGVFPGLYSSTQLGFRCVSNAPDASGDQGSGRIDLTTQVPVYTPTTEANFNAWLSHYRYDKTPLDAEIIDITETDAWRREKIAYKGADDARVIAYLYLPKNASPPYQIMQFVPAGDVYGGYITIAEATEILLAPFIKSGRAVFAVVFKGFKEREHPADYVSPAGSSVRFRQEVINNAIDLRRGLDYLETRPDLDARRLIYYGYSSGAEEGLIFTAVEARYGAVVLVAGGVKQPENPWIAEAWPLNFAAHIRAPKLMLNGRYDEAYPHKTDVEPLYKLLREPKRLVVYEAGHTPPIEIAVPAVNDWLNETLGPVKRE